MNTRQGRGKGRHPQSAVTIVDNPTTIYNNSRQGVNQGRGEQRATSSGTPAAAAGSKRGVPHAVRSPLTTSVQGRTTAADHSSPEAIYPLS